MIVYKVVVRKMTKSQEQAPAFGWKPGRSRTKFESIQKWSGSVEYEIGKTTEAKVGKLLCFPSLKRAIGFMSSTRSGRAILECETEDNPEEIETVAKTNFDNETYFKKYWEGKVDISDTFIAPYSTIGVNSIKVIRSIPRKELRSHIW